MGDGGANPEASILYLPVAPSGGLFVVVGLLFAEQNTPLQPLPNRHLPPPFSLATTDSRGSVEVIVDSIQTVQAPPLSAVRLELCSAEQYVQ